jgi:hypothetical protein
MWIRQVFAVAVLAVAGMGVAVPAASANDCGGAFCAYDDQDFQDLILRSNAPVGSKADVADDRTSSADNETTNIWVGRNRRFLRPDQTVFTWHPGTEAADLGDGDNKIDHFDVR